MKVSHDGWEPPASRSHDHTTASFYFSQHAQHTMETTKGLKAEANEEGAKTGLFNTE